MIQRAGGEARLGFPVHPHMLRHSWGYKLANDGHDTRAIQHYLGHKNTQDTVRYRELAPTRLKISGEINDCIQSRQSLLNSSALRRSPEAKRLAGKQRCAWMSRRSKDEASLSQRFCASLRQMENPAPSTRMFRVDFATAEPLHGGD